MLPLTLFLLPELLDLLLFLLLLRNTARWQRDVFATPLALSMVLLRSSSLLLLGLCKGHYESRGVVLWQGSRLGLLLCSLAF